MIKQVMAGVIFLLVSVAAQAQPMTIAGAGDNGAIVVEITRFGSDKTT